MMPGWRMAAVTVQLAWAPEARQAAIVGVPAAQAGQALIAADAATASTMMSLRMGVLSRRAPARWLAMAGPRAAGGRPGSKRRAGPRCYGRVAPGGFLAVGAGGRSAFGHGHVRGVCPIWRICCADAA